MTKTMENNRLNGTLMDVDLFKIIGLYRLLHKSSTKNGYWGTSDWYRILLMKIVWLLCGLLSMQFVRLYLTYKDLQVFLFTSMLMIVGLFYAFKGYVLVKNADRLLAVIDATRFEFIVCSRRDPFHLRKYRNVLFHGLRFFVMCNFIAMVIWILAPLFLREKVPFAKRRICLESEHYNELILLIKCNQEIIKIYDEFLDIIQPVVIIQMMSSMYATVIHIFSGLLLYLMGSSILSMPVLKLIVAYGSYMIELYMYCYIIDRLETTKSKLNNGLWNGNWTERDMKFRKTLLMAMIMNSSHNRKLKISPNSIINLEMFLKAMKMSYTVVSVLLNTRNKI